MHAGRNDHALQRVQPLADRAGDVGRVAARLLRHRDGHRRCIASGRAGLARGRAEPGVVVGQVGTRANAGHVGEEHRLAVLQADHQLRHLRRVGEEAPGGHRHVAIAAHALAGLAHRVGCLQRVRQVARRHAVGGQLRRIQLHHHGAGRCADGVDITRARHALQFGFQRVRHLGQLHRALRGIVAPQGQRHHRHVVDAHRPHQRRAHAEAGRYEALVLEHLVVQPHDRRLPRHADPELHRHHRHAGPAHRIDVLDALDPGQLLLQRKRHQVLHVAHVGAGERHHHVGHGHVDLRLFLARRDHHRDQAKQQRRDGQDRGQRRILERAGDAAGEAEPWLAHGVAPRRCAASQRAAAAGSAAMRSPSSSPASTSIRSPWR
ncbi:hypothetical protein RLIN73S_01905 [Rhodanobacter lindaniclasticus]